MQEYTAVITDKRVDAKQDLLSRWPDQHACAHEKDLLQGG